MNEYLVMALDTTATKATDGSKRYTIRRGGTLVGSLLYTGIRGISTWNLYVTRGEVSQRIPGGQYDDYDTAVVAAHDRFAGVL